MSTKNAFDSKALEEAQLKYNEFNQAKNSFDHAFHDFILSVRRVSVDNKNLWKFVARLTGNVLNRPKEIEVCCYNTICMWEDNDFLTVFQSIATIEEIKSQAGEALYDIVKAKGDDDYGDLIDSIFLAGPNVVGKILSRNYKDEETLKADIKSQCGEIVFNIIWNGENYFSMRLEEVAKKFIKNLEPITYEATKNELEILPWYKKF